MLDLCGGAEGPRATTTDRFALAFSLSGSDARMPRIGVAWLPELRPFASRIDLISVPMRRSLGRNRATPEGQVMGKEAKKTSSKEDSFKSAVEEASGKPTMSFGTDELTEIREKREERGGGPPSSAVTGKRCGFCKGYLEPGPDSKHYTCVDCGRNWSKRDPRI